MDLENVLRHFGDICQLDPGIPLANKILDILKDNKREFDVNIYWKILRYIQRSKNPRLYV